MRSNGLFLSFIPSLEAQGRRKQLNLGGRRRELTYSIDYKYIHDFVIGKPHCCLVTSVDWQILEALAPQPPGSCTYE